MYAAQKVGPAGKVLAVDLSPLSISLPAHGQAVVGDALTLANEQLASFAPYDVVLSDMAPKTSGNRMADQARSFDLFMRALDVAANLAKTGGAFVGKIFMGEDLPKARTELRRHFENERLIRPEGTRSVSYEIFVIGLSRRGGAANTPAGEAR